MSPLVIHIHQSQILQRRIIQFFFKGNKHCKDRRLCVTIFNPQCQKRFKDKTFVTTFDMKDNNLYKPFHVLFTKYLPPYLNDWSL
jgi:hypothetical protein